MIYHIYGIILYLTFFLYSLYPFNSLSNSISSLLILLAIKNGYIKNTINDISEPNTKGIDKNKNIVDVYIGCLTILYNPVSITF